MKAGTLVAKVEPGCNPTGLFVESTLKREPNKDLPYIISHFSFVIDIQD